MSMLGFPDALGVLCQDAGGDVHRVLAAACGLVPAWDPVVHLADFSRTALFPLAPTAPDTPSHGFSWTWDLQAQ